MTYASTISFFQLGQGLGLLVHLIIYKYKKKLIRIEHVKVVLIVFR